MENKNYIKVARETLSTYQSIGDEVMVDLQHILAVNIGSSATSELCGRLAGYGLGVLSTFSINELENEGLTHNQALRLFSAFSLANKIKKLTAKDAVVIRSPEDAADYMMEEMRLLKQEHFVALYLDTKNKVKHKKTVFIGSLNASVVHPREVFNEALKQSAASIIVLHNHPSGDPAPSQEDIHVTKRLVEAGKVIGIEVLDHIVIGDNRFASLKEKGYL